MPTDLPQRLQVEADNAARKGKTLVLSHERLSGYPPAGGYDSKLIAERLSELLPGARVLIVIREQKSFIRSMYSQYVTDGGDLPLRRFLITPEAQYNRLPGWDFDFLEYDRLIEYYLNRFSVERVLVLPFEFLAQAPSEFLDEITAFCGHDPADVRSIPTGVVHSQRPVVLQAGTRIANRYLFRTQLSPHGTLRSLRYPRAVLRLLAPVIETLSPSFLTRHLDQRSRCFVEKAVDGKYGESNKRTGALIGKDLTAFGYDVGS